MQANIQCANERVELHDNRFARTGKMPPPNPAGVLASGESIDMVVDYALTQVGNHVCVPRTLQLAYLDTD